MKQALRVASLLTAAGVLVAGSAFAGSLDGTVIALHSKAKAAKAITICTTSAPTIPCSDYAVDNQPTLTGLDVYLVAARAPVGVAGVSCGILATPNAAIFGFELCSDLDFPNGAWPGSGGGDRITWAAVTNCQETVRGTDGIHAVAGAFYVYAYGNGTMQVTPNNGLVIPELRVADCGAAESNVNPADVATVGFGTEQGYNPCTAATPVEATTWGAIKTLGSE